MSGTTLDLRGRTAASATGNLGTDLDPQVERIARTPEFQQLVAERTRFGWTLTILMLVVYFGFIGLIAFDKSLLAVKVGGTASLGLFMGVFVILFAFALTGIYVARANTRFDALSAALKRSVAPMNRLLLGVALATIAAGAAYAAGPDLGAVAAIGHELAGHRHVPVLRAGDARHHLQGRHGARKSAARLLRGRRRHLAGPERPRDRRRLHVGGLVPRHLRPGLHLGLRRADLLDRLPGRLADRAVPDRRAAAQPRQVHLRRRRLASASTRPRSASSRRSARWWWWPST